ncbi:MAG: Ig-like domain-containing protein, partial [Lachnospiraceae bacterium]|nr:Ig-like domain-containing protein [Lachnospiraceae bacterium]
DGKLTVAGTGKLDMVDKMSDETIDAAKEAGLDPADGIKIGYDSAGGTADLNGGSIYISCGGDGIKAKNGTINVNTGSGLRIVSGGDALKAKRDYDDENGDGSVNLNGGDVYILSYDDGIQAENINIKGGDIYIKTLFENAADSYYVSGKSYSASGNVIYEENSTKKVEYVVKDTGSHKALKAGTKGKTAYYGYTIADDNSSSLTDPVTTEASGSINISGGKLEINTLSSGIKANSVTTSGYSAAGNGVYFIGSPDDGISSNNTIDISGGEISISAGDDGITAAGEINITGSSVININDAYEGVEAKTINIGESGSSEGPSITVKSNDDGINTTSKSLVYYYESTDNEDYNYKKVSTSNSSGNNTNIYSGNVKVYIDSENSKSIKLASGDSTKTITYKASGDGIDCNGALDIEGGNTYVFGQTSGDNSPIDTNDGFTLADTKATVFLTGCDSMGESKPKNTSNYYSTGSSQQGPGGGGQQPFNNLTAFAAGPSQGGSSSYTAGSVFKVTKSGSSIFEETLPYNASFLLFASPDYDSSCSCSVGQSSESEVKVESISLNKTTLSLKTGNTSTISASVSPSNATNSTLTWTSDNESVATVSSSGLVTAISEGSAVITASATDGSNVSASCTVTVSKGSEEEDTPKVKSITLSTLETALKKGASATIKASVTADDGANTDLEWTSSDDSVVSVENGKLYAISAGSATITARACDGSNVSASCKVSVYVPLTSLKADASSLTMVPDTEATIKATYAPSDVTNLEISAASSDESVASVEKSGETGVFDITAQKEGTSTITIKAESDGNVTKTCSVKVTVTSKEKAAAKKVSISFIINDSAKSGSCKLGIGSEITASAALIPAAAESFSTVSWASSDESVLTVEESEDNPYEATVKALKAGSAKLTVTTDNGKKATATIKVGEAVKGITIASESATIAAGKSIALKPSVTNRSALNKTFECVSDDESVAKVSKSGVVKAVGEGSAVITVKTTDGSNISKEFKVTSYYPVSKIKLSSSRVTTGVKDSVSLSAFATLSNKVIKNVTELTDASKDQYSYINWTSSNESIATVANGVVRPLTTGTVKITATNPLTNKKASCSVVIKSNISGVDIRDESLSLKAGKSANLKYSLSWDPEKVAPANKNVSFSSSDESVVTVNNKGRVTVAKTAESGASALVTITTEDGGFTDTCTINVE